MRKEREVKLRIALMALAATALIGLAACGGDDDDDTTEAATTTEQTTTQAGGGGGGGGGESTVKLAADPGGALAYDADSLEADAGEVTIDFTNEASLAHDVRVEDADGENLGGTSVFAEGEESATVELESGEYTFFCSVPGHREGGMEGTLTVK
jgi:plastocyanin